VAVADGSKTGLRAPETSEFDVMLVDIFMPHMRGFESIRVFHERAPAIPLYCDVRLCFCECRFIFS
jgi:YesN/AraC family two-component response regulator